MSTGEFISRINKTLLKEIERLENEIIQKGYESAINNLPFSENSCLSDYQRKLWEEGFCQGEFVKAGIQVKENV